MNYIIAEVVTSSADDSSGRVKVKSLGIWEESDLIPSIGFIPLTTGDWVIVDLTVGIEYPLIMGKYKSPAQAAVSPKGSGEIIWETIYEGKWAQLRSVGNTTVFKNSAGVEMSIDGSKVVVKATTIEVEATTIKVEATSMDIKALTTKLNTMIDTPQLSTGPPEMVGPFCALPACLLTGVPHRSHLTL